MSSLDRIKHVEAQLEDIGSSPTEGLTDAEIEDDIRRFKIMCSLMRGLHDYSVINVPGVNYFDGGQWLSYIPTKRLR